MKRILIAVAFFLLYLSVVGTASVTRGSLYFRIADLTLVSMHLALLVFLSVLVLQERWKDRRQPQPRPTLLQRLRGWITDDPCGD